MMSLPSPADATVSDNNCYRRTLDRPPVWDLDDDACKLCHRSFTFLRRRHHCRNCGGIYCWMCSASYIAMPWFGADYSQPKRVCDRCEELCVARLEGYGMRALLV